MRLTKGIDLRDVQGGATEFAPLPDGVYRARILACSEEETQDRSSYMLKFEFSVLDEGYEGRRLWGYILTAVSDPRDAQKLNLPRRHLANLLDACGLGREVSDTDVFINRILPLKVKVRPAHDGYAASNSIVEYGIGADADWRPSSDGTVSAGSISGLKKPPKMF